MHGKLRLDAIAVRLRYVEDDARRAAAGVERDLQVLDLVVECGCVERNSVAGIFDSGFVVPQRLVLVVLEATEGREVGRLADRHVERIVHAAQAKALGNLKVDAEAATRLPAQYAARRKAARARPIGAVVTA